MDQNLLILIVDDDRRMTRTLADILTMAGHTIVEASSGQEALAKIHTQNFDCVLTDVRMPGMDGVEFHHQLCQSHPGLPVILMTAYASDEIINKGLDEGVVGVFDKPLDINHMLGFFASLAKHRAITIVDNDPTFCRTLSDILQQRGFKVAQITDPHINVERMASDAQVVLLDLKLNSITGLDIFKEIRKRHPTLPILLVTGYRQEMSAVIHSATEIDAFTCLYKPLEIPGLLQMLAKLQLQRLREVIKAK